MIDEKKLIEILSKNSIFEKITNAEGKNIFEIIESFPKVGEWIPCSEQLPKVPDGLDDDECPEFNVTIKGFTKATTLKFSSDGTWFDDDGYVYVVIAWQPLPEPYREG